MNIPTELFNKPINRNLQQPIPQKFNQPINQNLFKQIIKILILKIIFVVKGHGVPCRILIYLMRISFMSLIENVFSHLWWFYRKLFCQRNTPSISNILQYVFMGVFCRHPELNSIYFHPTTSSALFCGYFAFGGLPTFFFGVEM